LFWDEKRLWLGSGGLKCDNSVPKFEQESHPDHWGGPIDPKLCGPSSYVYQTWSASKKSRFRAFALSTPSDMHSSLFLTARNDQVALMLGNVLPQVMINAHIHLHNCGQYSSCSSKLQ